MKKSTKLLGVIIMSLTVILALILSSGFEPRTTGDRQESQVISSTQNAQSDDTAEEGAVIVPEEELGGEA